MKRHVTSLLQRKRSDFDGSQNPRQTPDRCRPNLASEDVQVKDGYDWLRQIQCADHRKVVRRLQVH